MSDVVSTVIEPFVRRGLFSSTEQAVLEMARQYVLGRIEYYRATVDALEKKYSMNYEQFEAYLRSRSESLSARPDVTLNRAIMAEEEDSLEWKIARDMLESWLGLQREVRG
ncbi:MAG: hypothetical protein JXA78_13815 [Anaerolineales bacterium]|nr:hypothetical protein [Anaerolineales bacterium]